jgi:hypothetical protein
MAITDIYYSFLDYTVSRFSVHDANGVIRVHRFRDLDSLGSSFSLGGRSDRCQFDLDIEIVSFRNGLVVPVLGLHAIIGVEGFAVRWCRRPRLSRGLSRGCGQGRSVGPCCVGREELG